MSHYKYIGLDMMKLLKHFGETYVGKDAVKVFVEKIKEELIKLKRIYN